MKVICRTNLDLSNERWPDEMPEAPRVGDHVRSRTSHNGFELELQVVRVTWRFFVSGWVPEIELHMTQFHRSLPSQKPGAADGSIQAFYEWYAPLVGREVFAFI
jgi:hypothetical protein